MPAMHSLFPLLITLFSQI